jgi:hypothetical protein
MSEVKLQEGIIYMIDSFDKDVKGHYIGSTLQKFNQRRKEHKSHCTNENSDQHHKRLYFHIRQHGNWQNWKMDIIERVLVEDEAELRLVEQSWIDILEPDLNQNKAVLTREQMLKDKRDRQKIYNARSPIIQCNNCDMKVKKCIITKHQKTVYCQNYIKKL